MPIRSPFSVFAAAAIVALALAASAPLAAADGDLPMPGVTIYPGDRITDAMLVDRPPPTNFPARGAVIDSRAALVGKVARRTLLPGQPIPLNAVGEPKIITNGAMVRIVFEEGGLSISTYGAALQAGAVGDVIPVRNLQSGLIVSGVVAADGTVHVSNS